jgi:endonuclease/exonuclease/phosphatase family metal-dependent hydrolase
MKILHWNIHMWQDADGVDNIDRVFDVINGEQPDAVTLVEIDERWGRPEKLQSLAERLGYHWVFVPAFEYRTAGGFGNALLSKAPFQAVEQWQLLPPMLYTGTEPTEPRAVVLGCVPLAGSDGETITIGATHLPRHDDQLRQQALDRLLSLVSAVRTPWVICGDFNQPAAAWDSRGWLVAPEDAIPTYPADDPIEPIDYCLSGHIKRLTAKIKQADGSDHLPLVVETGKGCARVGRARGSGLAQQPVGSPASANPEC